MADAFAINAQHAGETRSIMVHDGDTVDDLLDTLNAGPATVRLDGATLEGEDCLRTGGHYVVTPKAQKGA